MSNRDPLPLLCPFCGREPEIQPWHGGGPNKHMVSCANDYECNANPSTTGETRAEAIRNWNQRPTSKRPRREARP